MFRGTKILFTGTGKYLRLGSKGNRYKLTIDDIELSDWMKKEMHNSELKPNAFIRNRKIEVSITGVMK